MRGMALASVGVPLVQPFFPALCPVPSNTLAHLLPSVFTFRQTAWLFLVPVIGTARGHSFFLISQRPLPCLHLLRSSVLDTPPMYRVCICVLVLGKSRATLCCKVDTLTQCIKMMRSLA
jgi:hypothetical protein